jgi:glycosyltransferase involved in cell wall biosynthesis
VKRLLLISYYYPPLAGSGVFRPLRLSRYLPECGWAVTVLTVGERARVLKDAALQREVPKTVRVERTLSLEPRLPLLLLRKLGLRRLTDRIEPWLCLPDDQRGWIPFATRRGSRLLRGVPHDVVISTSAPYSAHLVGLRLRERFDVAWVADFRDEWTANPYLSYPSDWHRRLNRRLERRVLGRADRVVCVSEPWLASLAARVPDAPSEKFCELPNGFDGDHFADTGPLPDRFRIVYTGTSHGPRSPEVFLRALECALEHGRIPREELDVVFVGHTGSTRGLDRLPDCVRVIGTRPHHEALSFLTRAAVLLLVIPPEGGAGNHTGKLFNYLASGKPILALAPRPNVAADLIRRTRSGRIAPADDPHGVEEVLVDLYQAWKAGRSLPDQDRELVANYEARAQARDWASMLDELIASRRDRSAEQVSVSRR